MDARSVRSRHREVAADLLVATFEQRLSTVERGLDAALQGADPASTLPLNEGAVLVRFASESVRAWPAHRLLYYPAGLPAADVSDATFARADDLEFGLNDSAGAIAVLAGPARSTDSRVAAGALAVEIWALENLEATLKTPH